MSYTPGPWEAKEDDYGYWGVYNNAGECLVEATEPEDDANIHLLAAAPEMVKKLDQASCLLHDASTLDWPGAQASKAIADGIDALLRRIDGEEQEV